MKSEGSPSSFLRGQYGEKSLVVYKRSKQTKERLEVKLTLISVHGAQERLAQAIELLLKSAVINNAVPQANLGKDNPIHPESAPDIPFERESSVVRPPSSESRTGNE